MSRRANYLDLWEGSSEKVVLNTRSGNASVSGLDFGFFKFEYGQGSTELRVSLYADKDDVDPVAQSADMDAMMLPDWVDLAEYGGSGVTAQVFVDGVRGVTPAETLFLVGDLHYKDDDSTNARNLQQVECMNDLPGTAYPEATGGYVAPPRAVLDLGDTIHGSIHLPDAWSQYFADYGTNGTDGTLLYPHYAICGNHDFSGPEPDYVRNQIIARYGAGSYVVEYPGFTLIMVDYGPDADQLAWVQTQLAAIGTSTPIIIATHIGFDDTNSIPDEWSQAEADAFIAAIASYNVIGYFYGHVHTVSFYTYSGLNVYRVGSPADEFTNHNSVVVVKITQTNMYVNEYQWSNGQWDLADVVVL
jgi:hypothetical protein